MLIAIIVILFTVFILLFNKGASEPDSLQKRQQDWESLQTYIKHS